MGIWQWVLVVICLLVLIWVAAVAGLLLVSRRSPAARLGPYVPQCAVLFRRLAADSRVPRLHKAILLLAAAYVTAPLDLVPDRAPVVGRIDDAMLCGAALRYAVRSSGPELLTELWPGEDDALGIVLHLAHGRHPLASLDG